MRPRPVLHSVIGIVLLAAAARAQTVVLTPNSPVEQYANMLDRSGLAFTARVRTIGGTTTASVPASPTTSIVEVRAGTDLVFQLPAGFRSVAGRRITIIAHAATDLVIGAEYLLFANTAASDTGTALRLVALVAFAPPDLPLIAERMQEAREFSRRRQILATAQRSTVVALGTVSSISAPPIVQTTGGETAFHWREATVTVERVYKPGSPSPGTQVRVLYLGRRHIVFRSSPRLVTGMTRIFLLRPISTLPESERVGLPANVLYYVLDPLDVLQPSDSVIVR
jgi:hypothetical protein